jgi:alkanesulfonate monooxygenase SsuD/methylene tetrahydromethanopterin reductase-like flavin-dependent oxidoreductase (luciferase family)
MKFSFWPRPTHPFATTLDLAHHVEKTGWDGFWLADHFMPNAEDTSAPWPEAFTTLAAVAASVPRIRFGSLVAGNTYRHPACARKNGSDDRSHLWRPNGFGSGGRLAGK